MDMRLRLKRSKLVMLKDVFVDNRSDWSLVLVVAIELSFFGWAWLDILGPWNWSKPWPNWRSWHVHLPLTPHPCSLALPHPCSLALSTSIDPHLIMLSWFFLFSFFDGAIVFQVFDKDGGIWNLTQDPRDPNPIGSV